MNKKGVSLGTLTEMILGIILVLLCLIIVVANLNVQYGQNNDPTFGISTNSTLDNFKDYQGTIETGMQGEASTNQISGISLSSSWGIIKTGLSLVFGFVTGQWIQNAAALLHLGSAGMALALILRLLFIFAIGFILLRILFKINV
jgi:hypothetical protein